MPMGVGHEMGASPVFIRQPVVARQCINKKAKPLEILQHVRQLRRLKDEFSSEGKIGQHRLYPSHHRAEFHRIAVLA